MPFKSLLEAIDIANVIHTGLESSLWRRYSIFQNFLKLCKSKSQSDFEQHLLWQQDKESRAKIKPNIISVIFSPWNSLVVRNLKNKTQVYETIMEYYRKNSSIELNHPIRLLSSILFQQKKIF